MKTFKQFYEGVTQGKAFPTSPFKLTPGKGYPSSVPFINLKGDTENKIFKWQRGKNKASFMAWYEIYKYRFPNHINLKKLYKIVDEKKKRDFYYNGIDLPYEPPHPLYNDYSGMSPSCLYYYK